MGIISNAANAANKRGGRVVAGLGKYFNTLSVPSMWGDLKVTLVPIDKNGRPADDPYSTLTQDASSAMSKAKDFAKGGMDSVKSLFSDKPNEIQETDTAPPIVEIDATSTVSGNQSKKLQTHAVENFQVFTDGATVDPETMHITGVIDKQKIQDFRTLINPENRYYVILSKPIGGSASDYNFSAESTLIKWSVTAVDITDDGHKNTVQVSISLTEIRMFTPANGLRVQLINKTKGAASGTKKVDNKSHECVKSTKGFTGTSTLGVSIDGQQYNSSKDCQSTLMPSGGGPIRTIMSGVGG